MAVVVSFVASPAFATNGMNLEGYGPVATGMGGASMAYDNGTAAMMNNPSTLSLMPEGSRLDVALGYLGPNITATAGGSSADSAATAFYMPALGWAKKSGKVSYGLGMFAQGGMGTEYAANSFLAAGSNELVRSEVSMGRLLVPVTIEGDGGLSLGASFDYVWAGMDIKMALLGSQFLDMAGSFGGSMTYGSVSGSMMDAFGGAVQSGMISNGQGGNPAPVNWGRFDFSNDSDFTGKAHNTGYAGKLGMNYKVSPKLSFGAAWHSATDMGDLETDNAKVTFNANVNDGTGNYVPMTIPVTGKIAVKDFQWPQMLGAGVAYQASDKLMVVFDYKWINWKAVMKDFNMSFYADETQSNAAAQGFANTTLDTQMYQNWENQNVYMLGAAYKVSDPLTVRAGLNIADNPIPDKYLNPLFPATIKNHVTLGGGYALSQASAVDLSLTYAPEVEAKNGEGVTVAHSQTNAQVMYSYKF